MTVGMYNDTHTWLCLLVALGAECKHILFRQVAPPPAPSSFIV